MPLLCRVVGLASTSPYRVEPLRNPLCIPSPLVLFLLTVVVSFSLGTYVSIEWIVPG